MISKRRALSGENVYHPCYMEAYVIVHRPPHKSGNNYMKRKKKTLLSKFMAAVWSYLTSEF